MRHKSSRRPVEKISRKGAKGPPREDASALMNRDSGAKGAKFLSLRSRPIEVDSGNA